VQSGKSSLYLDVKINTTLTMTRSPHTGNARRVQRILVLSRLRLSTGNGRVWETGIGICTIVRARPGTVICDTHEHISVWLREAASAVSRSLNARRSGSRGARCRDAEAETCMEMRTMSEMRDEGVVDHLYSSVIEGSTRLYPCWLCVSLISRSRDATPPRRIPADCSIKPSPQRSSSSASSHRLPQSART
jgi:hypothetical protein